MRFSDEILMAKTCDDTEKHAKIEVFFLFLFLFFHFLFLLFSGFSSFWFWLFPFYFYSFFRVVLKHTKTFSPQKH